MSTVEEHAPETGVAADVPAAADVIVVRNPATGDIIRTVAAVGPDQIPAVVARARAAQPAWERMGFDGRATILRRAEKWLMDNTDRVIATLCAETGKTYEDALMAEVAYGAAALGFWARHAPWYLDDETVHSANPLVAGRALKVTYRPIGVVGIIGPWNYPLVNSFGDAIPALAAGNAVVLKPSSLTPLTSLLLLEGMQAAGLPNDVLQVIPGPGSSAGGALIDEVDFVMFTGSTPVGRQVMERAAKTLTPVSLELGGKDPMIVLADADLERAANAAVHYAMQNAGQACIAVERVYVEAPVHDAFVAKVAEKARALRTGPPGREGTVDVGALTSPAQMDIVRRHVQEARDAGARVLTGGKARDGRGQFFEPTVLVDVDHSMSAMTEETFGPTLPIMRVADAEEAIRLANDSEFGLAASVWTRDKERGQAIARRLQAGAVCVNDAMINYMALELPMGGWKDSGLGVRHGAGGIRKYTRQQAVMVNRFPVLKKEMHMMAYKPRMTRLVRRIIWLLYRHRNRS
jgi:acyl-CoA reductase-like NAD-dependent aldehyde dehydrogenase